MRPVRDRVMPQLFWCDRCNVPLIGSTCGRCGRRGRRVELSPPGDIRPAMRGTKRRLRYLFLRQFGVQQLVPEIVVLNKSSGEDRAEEVIIDGRRVALLSYDLEKKDHFLTLRIDGARMLVGLDPKRMVTLRKADGHMKGRYLPPEAIESYDRNIAEGDEVIIRMGKFIGCGSARVRASGLRASAKGIKVRDITQAGPLSPGKRAWPKDMLKANLPYIAAKKARAEHELKEAISKLKLPLTVSFSGGKDSLVVLDLVSSITRDFTAVFIDTGLEHPQTREYVTQIAKEKGLRLLVADAGNAFEDNYPVFGPPAKDFRWCCKVCKLAPVTKLIDEQFPHGTATVEGNRRLESFSRARLGLVEQNPFVPGQTIINPIRDWTGLDVWLYIMMRGLRYNPLYDEDIERVGCWMCPSTLASECADIGRLTPELAKWWEMKLVAWAEENNLPREFVDYGFWRWKEPPPKMHALGERLGLRISPKRADTLRLSVIKGVSPCASGGYSVEAVLKMPADAGLRRTAEVLKTVGDVRIVEDFGVVMVDAKLGRAKVFAGGQISAVADTPERALRLFDKVARATLRAGMCTRCGICVTACPEKCIRLDGTITVDERACARCGKCAEGCVVAHYFDKLAGGLPSYQEKSR
ncbi:MAG: phosphoadenosine phosphosulfate reductase family protein [Thermoplasmata archaeon]